MQVRLEKINPARRERRFYALAIVRTLFGEWCLLREWGRIGAAGGQRLAEYLPTRDAAETALQKLKMAKNRRGYATIPVQLELFPGKEGCHGPHHRRGGHRQGAGGDGRPWRQSAPPPAPDPLQMRRGDRRRDRG